LNNSKRKGEGEAGGEELKESKQEIQNPTIRNSRKREKMEEKNHKEK
jgi:hypothetical protein